MSTESLGRHHRIKAFFVDGNQSRCSLIKDVFINTTANNIKDDYDDRQGRRGWSWTRNRPLVATTVVHASLYLAAVFFLGSGNRALAKPLPGFPGPWFIGHLLVAPSHGISVWFWYLWCKFGFRYKSKTKVAFLHLGFIALNLAWSPIVFGLGAAKVGLFISLANLVILFTISYQLKEYLNKIGIVVFLISCGQGSFALYNLSFILVDQ